VPQREAGAHGREVISQSRREAPQFVDCAALCRYQPGVEFIAPPLSGNREEVLDERVSFPDRRIPLEQAFQSQVSAILRVTIIRVERQSPHSGFYGWRSAQLETSYQREANVANVQTQFNAFNTAIRLGRFGEEQTLRDKRDLLRARLEEKLPGVFERHSEDAQSPTFADQGSYEMGTGVKSLDGRDYDIDQGVYFEVPTSAYEPVELKERVFEALEGHTPKVEVRRACVTVFYEENGDPLYHVDLAVYSSGDANPDGKDYLARGKVNSGPEFRTWGVSSPGTLKETLFSKFASEDGRSQFRHVVRYLKRWKDLQFQATGLGAPRGIALTVIAQLYGYFPHYIDPIARDQVDDLAALIQVVDGTIAAFVKTWDQATSTFKHRLAVRLPVEPWSDLCERMTDLQLEHFYNKLLSLQEALRSARQAVDPVDACTTLRRQFGDDFPVPEKELTGKRHGPAIISSSANA